MAGGVAVGLSAVMILPFVEATGHAVEIERGGLGGPLVSLISIVAPDYWGDPAGSVATAGPLNYSERSLFVGIVALTFASVGVIADRSRDCRFFAMAAVLCALLAFETPILSDAIAWTGADEYLNFQRLLILVVFCLSVLAAYGFDRVLARDGRARRTGLVVAIALLVGCSAAALVMARSLTQVLGQVIDGALGDTPDLAGDLASSALGQAALV